MADFDLVRAKESHTHSPFQPPWSWLDISKRVGRVKSFVTRCVCPSSSNASCELETALAARGHRVEWSTELKSFEMDDDGVLATVDRGGSMDTIEAGWIVGCDGIRSVVRKALSPEFPGESFGLQGLICECDLDGVRSRDIWWTWQSREATPDAVGARRAIEESIVSLREHLRMR
jgi:FAD binding domain